ncbi:hypothetical protein MMC21_000734 [Puttea exsequens]|nr:hypothetical protein [Puttea exsequens]
MHSFTTISLIFVIALAGPALATDGVIQPDSGTAFGGALDLTITLGPRLEDGQVNGPLTVHITNSFGAGVSISYTHDVNSPSALNVPQPGTFPVGAATQIIYPTGWAGLIFVGREINAEGSKIEASCLDGNADVDVSYVDGYTVPITCSCSGAPVTGCYIDLFGNSFLTSFPSFLKLRRPNRRLSKTYNIRSSRSLP